MHVFYTPDIQAHAELPEEEAAHAVRVLRLQAGDEVMLTDGKGCFYRAEISTATNKRCLVNILETLPQAPLWKGHLHIAMAPTKNMDRTEWFAEKATEIGFDELTFLNCRFSERKVIKTERISKILVSAIKQSLKARLPQLNEMTDFNKFITQPFPGQKFIAHCYEGEKPLLKDMVHPGEDALVLIGPEGDFSEEEVRKAAETAATESTEDADQAAADEVAAMIDAIYVQERTENTDKQCADAKAAWDALTDAQKELVEGENADPDYFGRDTGDASKDDPRNQDEIGENEILVVSFGTSFNDSRVADIKGIEDAIAAANPDWSVRRAFTAQIIINHIQARDDEHIDNMDQALDRAVANGVKNLVVQPTHLMHGAEYDELMQAVEAYKDQFASVKVAEPLLGEVGDDATVVNADKKAVAEDLTAEAVKTAGYDSLDAAKEDGVAFVFMGHGTSHTAKVSYSQMQTQMNDLGYANVFIGTVEGEPEETACEEVIKAVAEAGYTKVVLRPLMVVAGDHANNDMAGEDEDSWLSQFNASGKFDSVDTQISGLGGIKAIQDLYVAHTAAAMAEK